ncbi:hypothetical protein B0H13DRAFT_2678401 [Mycena leptocephala]|nr:hypothetical protein B0H13DRAFT_2678401 [Mycena leptocephala]
MGYETAQRMFDYICVIVDEFLLRPEYKDLILMFGIMNEATEWIANFYLLLWNLCFEG